MGNPSDIEGYLSELKGRRKVELGNRDKKFLFEMLVRPESVYSLYKIINEKYEMKLPPEDVADTNQRTDPQETIYYITSGPLSRHAVRKRIEKLISYGLIERLDEKSLEDKDKRLLNKALFNAKLRRAKLYRVTEYGLFCVLSQETTRLSDVFLRHWQSKVMITLLSSYFEKKTFVRLTVVMYFTIVRFLHEACNITTEGLDEIEQAEKENDKAKYKEEIRRLEDDLLWHAKSFALRLMVDTASKDKDKSKKSRHILSFLAHDKKFVNLVIDTMHEILSYYGGGKLLELDKTFRP